jgi:hypothetical protein
VAKLCSRSGCTNQVKKRGLCITHGAMLKQCSHKGCNNHAKNGGFCITHGVEMKLEDEEELNSWIWRSSRIVPI